MQTEANGNLGYLEDWSIAQSVSFPSADPYPSIGTGGAYAYSAGVRTSDLQPLTTDKSVIGFAAYGAADANSSEAYAYYGSVALYPNASLSLASIGMELDAAQLSPCVLRLL